MVITYRVKTAYHSSRRLVGSMLLANRLKTLVLVIPVWDDHDFVNNDVGTAFAKRELAEAIFLKVWAYLSGIKNNLIQ